MSNVIAFFALDLIAAMLLVLFALPIWRTVCWKHGPVDHPHGRKNHDQPIPLAGGPAILTGLALTTAIVLSALKLGWLNGFIAERLLQQWNVRPITLAGIVLGTLGMTFLGWIDDRHELRPALKFLGQLLVGVGIAAAGVRCRAFPDSPLLDGALTVFWLLLVTNALNFTDNMNGLCAGLAALATSAITFLAFRSGALLAGGIGATIVGALIGFLPYNYPRASAFLGDSGSHLLGFLVGILAIEPGLWSATTTSGARLFGPLLLVAVPVADLVWVVAFRTWNGRPFYVADNQHFSHQLVRRGLQPPIAVLLIWILSACAAGLTLALR